MLTRLKLVLATTALGAAALIGAAACAPGASDATNALTPEATALTALGYTTQDLVPAAAPSATPSAGAKVPRPRRLRRALRGNVEHGEVVVQTKDGEKTIDVQRGTVTAIDSSTVTVKSADGFTLTWTLGNPIHVIEHRTTVQPSNVTVGKTIGIAGTKTGSTVTARLILLPKSS